MGYKISQWSREQLRFLKGEGAGAAKVLLMAMAESAGNTDPQWFGQEYELFENCGLAERSGRRGMELLKSAGLIFRERKGNQHGTTNYRVCNDISLSEPARLAPSEKVNRPILQVNRPESTSEPANMARAYKEVPSINSLIPSIEKPEWLLLLEEEVPKTQKVKWVKRWSELLMKWWVEEVPPDQVDSAPSRLKASKALGIAERLASHRTKYANYNLTFKNWYNGNREADRNTKRASGANENGRSRHTVETGEDSAQRVANSWTPLKDRHGLSGVS